jgi:ribosomal-protein-serine acetyltransferase
MRIPARDLLPPLERYTERLMLRPFKRRDIEALYTAVRDSRAELAEYLPWATKTFTRSGAAGFIRESMRSWREGKAYDFSIRLLERPERHVGNISIWHVSRSSRSGEIGYWIRTEDTGRGIATEATRAALRIGFEDLSMHRMVLRVAVGNKASERVATKLGFVREGVLREEIQVGGRWMDHSVWGLLDHEYRRLIRTGRGPDDRDYNGPGGR